MRKPVRVFYVSIGHLSSIKAKELIEKFKAEVMAGENSVYYENFFVATKEETRIEVFP